MPFQVGSAVDIMVLARRKCLMLWNFMFYDFSCSSGIFTFVSLRCFKIQYPIWNRTFLIGLAFTKLIHFAISKWSYSLISSNQTLIPFEKSLIITGRTQPRPQVSNAFPEISTIIWFGPWYRFYHVICLDLLHSSHSFGNSYLQLQQHNCCFLRVVEAGWWSVEERRLRRV